VVYFPVSDAARMVGFLFFYQFGFIFSTGVSPCCAISPLLLYSQDALRPAGCRGIWFVMGSVPDSPESGDDTGPTHSLSSGEKLNFTPNTNSAVVDAAPRLWRCAGLNWREPWRGHSNGGLIPSDHNSIFPQREKAASNSGPKSFCRGIADRGIPKRVNRTTRYRKLGRFVVTGKQPKSPDNEIMSAARRPPPWNDLSFVALSPGKPRGRVSHNQIKEHKAPKGGTPYVYPAYNFQRTSQALLAQF